MKGTVRFLFDYLSPYAYLASTQIRALAARHDRGVEPVPVLLAALLASNGARGPAEIPRRREYMLHDVTRLARVLDVPIQPPATHPFNPLAPLRLTLALEPEDRWPLVEAIFRAGWVEGRRIDAADVAAQVARGLGLDAEALAARAASEPVKSRLREITDAAIGEGVFGVPTFLVDGQLFWGVDSLHLLERFLSGADVPDPEELTRWRRVEPSATRR